MKEKATELEWLSFFYSEADFGPAHEDVMWGLKQKFKKRTRKDLPDGYEE